MNPMSPGTPSGRRSFLRLAGAVLAGGTGAIALGSAASAAPAPARAPGKNPAAPRQPGTKGDITNACAIFCTLECCNCCDNGSTVVNLYHCVSSPCGYSYYQCTTGSCASFCFSQNAC